MPYHTQFIKLAVKLLLIRLMKEINKFNYLEDNIERERERENNHLCDAIKRILLRNP